jgi:hypothetical protein
VTIIGVLHGDMRTGPLVRRWVGGEQSTARADRQVGVELGSSATRCPYTGI